MNVQANDFNSARDVLQRNNCFNCHNSSNPGRGNFEDYSEEEFLSNNYIVATNPTASLLIQRLKNNGGNMPSGGLPQISEADHQILRNWISSISSSSSEILWNGFQSEDPFLASINNSQIFTPTNNTSAQARIFGKCFRQFTRQEISATDPILTQVKSGAITGPQGCINLIQKAQFTVNGGTEIDKNDPMALDILDTFHNNFHSSWMPSRVHRNISTTVYNRYQNALYELNAPANYLTYALFSPNGRAKDILTLNETLQGIRFDQNLSTKSYVRKGAGVDNYIFRQIPSTVTFMEEGIITGIKYKDQTAFINRATPLPLFRSYGAGVLEGSYFMLRGGSYIQQNSNGAFNVPRTTVKNILEDLLGRSLPMVRVEDVLSENLVHETGESPLAYRNGTACMACHSTMDQMAQTFRNILIFRNEGTAVSTTDNTDVAAIVVQEHSASVGAEDLTVSWNDDPVTNFHRRPANGKLFYRDYKGELINERILGISALGEHFSERLDFYMNISNRYLFWLTGTRAYLGDLGNPLAPNLTVQDLELRKFVIWLATNLKNDQDIKKLISRILQAKLYLGTN